MENALISSSLVLLSFWYCQSQEIGDTNQAGIACNETFECCTPQCISAAQVILESMNTSVDPCNDFYEYACGAYISKSQIDESQQYASRFLDMERSVNETFIKILNSSFEEENVTSMKAMKLFYSSCMHEDEIVNNSKKELFRVLSSMGGWPVLSTGWSDTGFSLYQQLVNVTRMGSMINAFFSLDIGPEGILLERFLPILRYRYFCNGLNDSDVQAYYRYMVAVVIALGANETIAERDMWEVLDLEYNLAKIRCYSYQQNRTIIINEINKLRSEQGKKNVSDDIIENQSIVVKLKDLDETFPGFPWSQFINVTFTEFYNVTENDNVTVPFPLSTLRTTMLINNATNRSLSNLVLWTFVHSLIPSLSAEIRQIRFNFSAEIDNKDDMFMLRNFQCLKLLQTSFSGVFLSSFLKLLLVPGYEQQARDIINKTNIQLIESVRNISWMNESDRKIAVEKAKALKGEFIVPEVLNDYGQNIEALEKMKLNNLTFFEMLQKLLRYDVIRQKSNTLKNITYENNDVFGGKGEKMEFYYRKSNDMDIPAGYFMEVLFNINRTSFLNFGGIAMKIGHCMGHMYDEQGLWYFDWSALNSTFGDETDGKQSDVLECLIEQYSNITVEQIGMKIDGRKTVNENFADNFAPRVAYGAFQNWQNETDHDKKLPGLNMTVNQMFWLQAASTNCEKLSYKFALAETNETYVVPRKYRVNTVFGNSEEFRRDWNCTPLTRMGSQKMCNVW